MTGYFLQMLDVASSVRSTPGVRGTPQYHDWRIPPRVLLRRTFFLANIFDPTAAS